MRFALILTSLTVLVLSFLLYEVSESIVPVYDTIYLCCVAKSVPLLCFEEDDAVWGQIDNNLLNTVGCKPVCLGI